MYTFGDPEAKAIVNEIVVGGSEKSLQINVSFAVKMLKGKKDACQADFIKHVLESVIHPAEKYVGGAGNP